MDSLPSKDINSFKEKILSEFECQKSGHCCKRPGYVLVTQKEIKKMADYVDSTVVDFEFQNVVIDNGWKAVATPQFRQDCFLNEKGQCNIYPVRPIACKTYPDWPELWTSWETLFEEAQECKGLKKTLEKMSHELAD
jgi:uncharacterized protein